MHQWLVRGIVMSLVYILVRIALGEFVINSPLESPTYRTLALAIVILVAVIWGGYDGIRDARANPDPDDYEDLTMRWLKAGFFAAVVSVVVCHFLGITALKGMGQPSWFIDLTAGVSFVTLMVLVPAFVGFSIGRYLVRREQNKQEQAEQEAAERSAGLSSGTTANADAATTQFAPIDGDADTAVTGAPAAAPTATALADRPTEPIATTDAPAAGTSGAGVAGAAAAGATAAAAGGAKKRLLGGRRRKKADATAESTVSAAGAAVPAGAHLPLADPNQVPDGFPIKGNDDSGLYHTPDSPWYSQTVAEMWFATEEAAQAAGYKHPGH